MKDKKHKEGFNLPNDYFEEFENRLFNKINSEILPKDDGFTVPEGYFKTLDEKISTNIANVSSQPKVISIVSRKTLLYAVSIAACAVFIFSLINLNNEEITMNDIDFTSIESYIVEGNIEITNNDLISLLTEDDLNELTIEESLIPEELIEEYLLDNIEDTSILIE